MPTEIIKKKKRSSLKVRKYTKDYYMTKYFDIFMHRWKVEELSYQENYFLFKTLWQEGKFAIWKMKHTDDKVVIAPFAEILWNLYEFPTQVNLINLRGSPFIPAKPQKVDEEVCICYALNSKMAVREKVEFIIDKIVACEELINISIDTHKMPFLIGVSPENKQSMQSIIETILAGESAVYCDIDDINSFKTLVNNSPFILDKLMQYKECRENELKTLFGIQNYNTQEKSQYINIDTTNSNNEEISDTGCMILDSLEELAERFEEIFNIKLTPKLRHEEKIEVMEEDQEEGENKNV